jgi:beta-galactosidase
MLSACDRRAFHSVLLTAACCLSPLSSVFAQNRVSSSPSGTPIYIDASTPAPAIRRVDAHLGAGQRPDGETLSANSQYLVLNGKPWLPVMGEFHYSRVPQQNWETEILKVKAGGVEVISTYVIWIHLEEVESQFDWTGRRNLRAFVLLCAKHGMFVYLRIGPWVHGETRNGGIPDWAMQRSPVRCDDPTYLAEVSRYFGEVGQQLASQLWSKGGPVIGIQLENEYMHGEKPGTGDDHIRSLKRIAMEAGLDTPLYTVTGWGRTAIPLDAVLPVYGAYPDAPWDGSPDQLPPNEAYDFRTANRASGNMGIGEDAEQNGAATYQGTPFLTAEVGGGMQDTYFRRPVISADDVAAVPTVLIGSGANSLGFYMYHGGRNPNGKLSTLQESQITDYPIIRPMCR